MPKNKTSVKSYFSTRCQWLIPAILTIQEAKIRKIMVGSQP
jgi:hypothetical protein